MNIPWILRLAREDFASLAPLRLGPAIEVAEDSDHLWLRGPACEGRIAVTLAALPARDRYERLGATRLRRVGSRIPSDILPALAWQPLATWLNVEAPIAALPAEVPRPSELRLVPSAAEIEPELLITTLAVWAAYARTAPAIRLQHLRFAADVNQRVIVQGRPLPPLPGKRYALHGRIAVPAGWRWQPAVSPAVVTRRFRVPERAVTLWHEDGTVTHLHEEQFITAHRRAVGATQELARTKEPM